MKPFRGLYVLLTMFLTGLVFTSLLFAAPEKVTPAEKETFENFICYNSCFTASIPSDWVRYEDIMDSEATREYGVDLRGPKNADGAYVTIDIIYYAPDHDMFKTAEDFIRANANLRETLKAQGESVTPVTTTQIAGRDAVQFDKKAILFLPFDSADPKKIMMFERLIIMKGKEGFYLLKYSAPEDLAAQYLKVFDQVAASFKPNV